MKELIRNFVLIYIVLILSACSSEAIQVDNAEIRQADQLRIINTGLYPIENLVVIFLKEKSFLVI